MNVVDTSSALEIRLLDASNITALHSDGNASEPLLKGCVSALDRMTLFIKSPTAAIHQVTYSC